MSFPIRAQLLGALTIDLLLVVALSIMALHQMGVMHSRATFVEAHTIPSLNGVAAINEVINRYRIQQLEYLIYTNAADKDRSRRKMAELELQMAAHIEAYRPLVSSPAEASRLANVEAAWGRVVSTNYSSFLPAASLANSGSVQPFYSRMNPLYGQLEAAMGRLAAESQIQASASLDVLRAAYTTARAFIALDMVLALVISAAIGLLLSGRISQRIRRLTDAANRVAAGDLRPRVEERGRDELGSLSRSFNQMVESLGTQRRILQQRNEALQASLERQEQLTSDLILRRQSEEEAHKAQASAMAASQAKSMFLATMSHELRTPLNAILGYAQLLRMTTPRQPTAHELEPEIDPLDRILAAGRHLGALINNVLDFSKIEQGTVELNLERFDPCAVAREAADVVAPLMERQQNTLHLHCRHDVESMYSDAGKLRQVLINLLSNAAKFTERGSVTLTIERDAADHTLRFAVSDTGIGIAAEHLDKLFQPFSQVDASVTRRYEGTGLGLALSRQLCTALGGTIMVASEPGHGSTFTVRLPCVARESQRSLDPRLGARAVAEPVAAP